MGSRDVTGPSAPGVGIAPERMSPTNGGDLMSIAGYEAGVTLPSATPSTPYESAALEASAVLKASAGTFRSLVVDIDPSLAAPTGSQVYWILLLKGSATVPADGDVSANLMRAVPVTWVSGVPLSVEIDEGDAGLVFTVGCTACLSLATASTWATKALSAAKCRFHGSVL